MTHQNLYRCIGVWVWADLIAAASADAMLCCLTSLSQSVYPVLYSVLFGISLCRKQPINGSRESWHVFLSLLAILRGNRGGATGGHPRRGRFAPPPRRGKSEVIVGDDRIDFLLYLIVLCHSNPVPVTPTTNGDDNTRWFYSYTIK